MVSASLQYMNSAHTSSQARKVTVALLVASAALFLGACSTTSSAQVRNSDKEQDAYAVLHGMMHKMAYETHQDGAADPVHADVAVLPPTVGAGASLASNQ